MIVSLTGTVELRPNPTSGRPASGKMSLVPSLPTERDVTPNERLRAVMAAGGWTYATLAAKVEVDGSPSNAG